MCAGVSSYSLNLTGSAPLRDHTAPRYTVAIGRAVRNRTLGPAPAPVGLAHARPSRPGAAGAWSRRGPAQAGGFLIFKKKQVEDKKYRDEMKVCPSPLHPAPRDGWAQRAQRSSSVVNTAFETCAC